MHKMHKLILEKFDQVSKLTGSISVWKVACDWPGQRIPLWSTQHMTTRFHTSNTNRESIPPIAIYLDCSTSRNGFFVAELILRGLQ
jgi:hypothetical protein